MRTGCSRAVVLLGEQGREIPVALTVIASLPGAGFEISAPCSFSPSVVEHLRADVFPLAQKFVEAKGQHLSGVVLTVSWPSSVKLHGEAVVWNGHSADVAVFVAMVSAALDLPLRQDVAMTGQLEAGSFAVGLVRGIARKVALHDSGIRVLLVPDWKGDAYFSQIYPHEFASVRAAVKASRMQVVAVKTVDEVLAVLTTQPTPPLNVLPTHGGDTPYVQQTVNMTGPVESASVALADVLLSCCQETELVRLVDTPLNERYATFGFTENSVRDWQGCEHAVGALLAHLGFSADANAVVRTLEGAFGQVGGVQTALAVAQDSSRGGLREVFSRVVAHVRIQERECHVRGVFQQAFDPLDGQARLAVVQGLLQRAKPLLPADVELAPVEFLANRPEQLVNAILALQKHLNATFSR